MSNKISKNLLLCSVLGALLFASAVPTAEAFSKLLPSSASHLEKGKQRGWFSKHWRAAAFAVGLGYIAVSGIQVYQNKQYEQRTNLVLEQINETEVAETLVDNDILSGLYRELLRGEEHVRLVYYTNDGEARIGWLKKEKDFKDNRLISPYKSDYKSRHDVNPIELTAVLMKHAISDYSNASDYLPFFLNNENLPIYETVPSGAIAGKLLSSGYTHGTTFSNEDGQELSGVVFATISPLEAKEKKGYPSTYVVLVTHRDGQELEAEDRYFTIMPDDLPNKYGRPPMAKVAIDL